MFFFHFFPFIYINICLTNYLFICSIPSLAETSKASSSIIAAWGAVRQALGSLAADKALAQALARRVSALEGVQSSDQDICQVTVYLRRLSKHPAR